MIANRAILLFALLFLAVVHARQDVKVYCDPSQPDSENKCSIFEACKKTETPIDITFEGICTHKDLFPMNVIEFIGCFLIIILDFIANAAGTAGGGVVIPLIMMFFGWDTKSGIAISNFTVVFTALTRYFVEYNHRNKIKGYGTIINYDYILLTIPPLKIGSAMGAIVNKILPEALIVIVLVFLLVIMFCLTLRKAITLFKKESDRMELAKDKIKGEKKTLTNVNNDDTLRESMFQEEESEELRQIKADESHHWQWPKLIVTWIMMAQLFIISLIRGDGDPLTGGGTMMKCTPTDNILLVLLIVNSIILEIVAIKIIKGQTERKIRANYKFVDGDIKCSVPIISKLILYSLFAGFASSSLGAGLALILAPILLECGLDPVSVAATEINQAFYSTITSTLIVIINGGMHFDYAIIAIIMAVIGAFAGMKAQNIMIEATGRPSLMVFLLAFCIAFCMILIPVDAIPELVALQKSGGNLFELDPYCTPPPTP